MTAFIRTKRSAIYSPKINDDDKYDAYIEHSNVKPGKFVSQSRSPQQKRNIFFFNNAPCYQNAN